MTRFPWLKSFSHSSTDRSFLRFVLVCALLKLLFVGLDPAVFTFNDSRSFVELSTGQLTVHPFRPNGYGWFLRAVWALTGGAVRLPVAAAAQVMLGFLVSLFAFAFSRRVMKAPLWGAWLAGLAVTVSPMNLLMERHILAETPTLFLFCLFLFFFFAFLDRPRASLAAAVGLTLAALPIFRATWVILAPVALALFALHQILFRALPWRRWAALAAVLLAAWWVPSAVYKQWYSSHLSPYARRHPCGPGMGGWTMWAKVCPLAEPADLADFPWGPTLLSDPASLKKGFEFQIWHGKSTSRRLHHTFGENDYGRTNALLQTAARRVILRHPAGAVAQALRTLPGAFMPASVEPPTVEKTNYKGPGALPPGTPARVSRLHGYYRAWLWTKPLIFLALVAAWVLGALRPRTHFPLLALATIALLHVALIAGLSEFFDRYLQPVEFLGWLCLAGLLPKPGEPPL